MIINHKRKFVFVCVPKTSSTTLSKHFIKVDEINLNGNKSWLKRKWHWPMKNIKKHYGHWPIRQYYKFAYHRNPWDRMISSWIEFTSEKGHLDTWSSGMTEDFKSFEDFILNFRDTKWAEDIHFQPTYWYTHCDRGTKIVDHIARYDDWEKETETIFAKIGLNLKDMQEKRWRKTKRTKDYKEYYTNDKMIDEVAQHFKLDIETFGDKF